MRVTTSLQVITILIISSVLLRRPFRDTRDDVLRADFTRDAPPRTPEFYSRYVQTRRHWLLFTENRADQNALWSQTCHQYPWTTQKDGQGTVMCLNVIADAIKWCSELINSVFAVLRRHRTECLVKASNHVFMLTVWKTETLQKNMPDIPSYTS